MWYTNYKSCVVTAGWFGTLAPTTSSHWRCWSMPKRDDQTWSPKPHWCWDWEKPMIRSLGSWKVRKCLSSINGVNTVNSVLAPWPSDFSFLFKITTTNIHAHTKNEWMFYSEGQERETDRQTERQTQREGGRERERLEIGQLEFILHYYGLQLELLGWAKVM